ncbi:MAG: phage baseplate assembly protein V [Zoogloeaceae bacterium]|jgi:phage baseplate assembly protein V|nr:phage baseplate assembly protein V [Zoogloeaceae bacterium]
MSYPVAETDRQGSGMLLAGVIHDVDYEAARARLESGGWISAWLPWFSVAAGEVRHWRPPSVGEQALLLSPSGTPEQGMIFSGVYSDQHKQANDNRKEFTATDWPDTAREHYDHDKSDHRHYFPPEAHTQVTVGGGTKIDVWKGKVVINVEDGTTLTLLPGATILKTGVFLVDAPLTEFTGVVQIDSLLHVAADTIVDGNVIIGGSDIAAGAQIDGGGNTNHHSHSVEGVTLGEDVVKTLPPPPPPIPGIPDVPGP